MKDLKNIAHTVLEAYLNEDKTQRGRTKRGRRYVVHLTQHTSNLDILNPADRKLMLSGARKVIGSTRYTSASPSKSKKSAHVYGQGHGRSAVYRRGHWLAARAYSDPAWARPFHHKHHSGGATDEAKEAIQNRMLLENQESLKKRFGIEHFEKRTPESSVSSIGYSPSKKKWYGWSHRAVAGFGVGDGAFPEPENSVEWNPPSEKDRPKIKNEAEAKQSAKNFASWVR